jgi:hypothetical protein
MTTEIDRRLRDWYGETHPNPFWMLFENQMSETPLVDF